MCSAPRYEVPPAPHDWIDWVVVKRLVAGLNAGPRRPTRAERRAATVEMLGLGLNHTQIGRHLHTSGTGAHEVIRSIQAELAEIEVDALRAQVGPLPVSLDINVMWISEPLDPTCDCGYYHPATCEVSYWQVDPINPGDGSRHQEIVARSCVPARVQEAAHYTDDMVTVELGLSLQRLAERAARVPLMDLAAA
jgi:hypothetical protein